MVSGQERLCPVQVQGPRGLLRVEFNKRGNILSVARTFLNILKQ